MTHLIIHFLLLTFITELNDKKWMLRLMVVLCMQNHHLYRIFCVWDYSTNLRPVASSPCYEYQRNELLFIKHQIRLSSSNLDEISPLFSEFKDGDTLVWTVRRLALVKAEELSDLYC